MRVVQVTKPGAGGGERFDLHERVTVVRGLRGGSRSWFVDAVGRLGPASTDDVVGQVEASGVVLPLDAVALDLLGIHRVSDAVVGTDRLLGDHPEAPVAGRPATAEADAAVPRARVATPLLTRIDALRQRRRELEDLVGSVETVDLAAVREALGALESAPDVAPEPEVAELAAAWSDLQKDLKGLELGTSEDEQVAIDAVARAREAVEEAEAALAKPQLTDDQMARIEAAHLAYLDASDKVERRFGGLLARRQLAEAEAEEARLLSRFGFASWVDYVISASKRTDDPEMKAEQEALAAAQAELEICLAELDAIPGAVGRRRRRAKLSERHQDLSERVARVLGHEPVGDAAASELLALTVPYEPRAEREALAGALRAAGIEVEGRRPEPDLLVAKARQAMAMQERSERRRDELQVAVDALAAALATLEAAAEGGSTEVPDMPPLPDMAEPPVSVIDPVGDEHAAEYAPDDVVARDRAEPTDGLDADPSPEPTHDLEPTHAPVELRARPDVEALPASSALVEEVHWQAMVAMASVRTDGPAGQLPVVFDEAFSMLDREECLDLLDRLVRLSGHVQMILLSDRPEVAEWADAIGPDLASVVEVAR